MEQLENVLDHRGAAIYFRCLYPNFIILTSTRRRDARGGGTRDEYGFCMIRLHPNFVSKAREIHCFFT